MSVLVWSAAIVLVIVGLAGILLPALPGTVLIFAGLLLVAWHDGFVRVGAPTLVVIGVLTAASYFVDMAMMALGMKRLGASTRAMTGAVAGVIVGAFFGIPGIVIGPFVGAVVGEWTLHRHLGRAGGAGLAAWIGFVFGTLVKVGLAFSMVGLFLAAWWLW